MKLDRALGCPAGAGKGEPSCISASSHPGVASWLWGSRARGGGGWRLTHHRAAPYSSFGAGQAELVTPVLCSSQTGVSSQSASDKLCLALCSLQ